MTYIEQKLREGKVFKDPVHGYVHVEDQMIWDLVATREFQRLRRIRQLGTTSLTFHGAEHSRFNHSLGVYEIVRQIIDVTFAEEFQIDAEERMVALCAALLHDLGHGPFSHAFEKVFGTDHEAYTREIITGDTEVQQVLKRGGEDFPLKVADIIRKTYPNQTLVKLISSQLDADRMDYLLRDAYYTGVSYGKFDMERILRVMRPSPDGNGVIIKYSGLHAVEDYLMSRYQMYQQVYFHPVSRSGEVLLWKILDRAKKLYEADYEFEQYPTEVIPFFTGEVALSDYIRLDDTILTYYFSVWQNEADEILSDLCGRFLGRRLLRYIDYDPAKDAPLYDQLKGLLEKADIDPTYYLVIDSSSDLPYDLYQPGASSGKTPIQLLLPSGELKELSTESPIVESIGGKIRTDIKLYYPLDFIENGRIAPEIAEEMILALHQHHLK
ncbi:HD domain-containing protein [Listeria costaricensis]|uniref:HD domain-containing protein n=1 Tax=Listeria costaricensis TaxID=2026604 RepID=UPI000C089249|nr:HD domain-containing protein [Listeria costaricensis]